MSSLTADAMPLSRRTRLRQETVAEIKALARKQLDEQGAGALSLRAIARQMGMASSALYRYFASQDDLISALCVAAYESLADALTTAGESEPPADHARRWWAICHAWRQWSLANPPGFALIFGTPAPGFHAATQATGPAAARAISVPFQAYAAAVQSGAADPDCTQVPATLEIGELLRDLLDRAAPDYAPRLAGIALNAWASTLGYLTAEIFGSLPHLVTDTDEMFRAHVRTVMVGMGFASVSFETADVQQQG